MARWSSLVIAALLCLAACDRGATATGPDCPSAATGVVKALSVSRRATGAAPQVRDALVATCTETRWSPEARSCMARATTRVAQRACWHKHLTGEQSDALTKAVGPLAGGAAEALRKMREFADEMCQCHDATCAQKVSDSMIAWSEEMAAQQAEPPKLSEEEMKQATEIGQRMGTCMQEAMAGSGSDPGPPPHALPPSPPSEGAIDPNTGGVIRK